MVGYRKSHPIKVVVRGDMPGIYYVPEGMQPDQAINAQNQIVSFKVDRKGVPSFETDNNGKLTAPKRFEQVFEPDRQKVVKEFFASIGMTRLGGAYRLFANSKGEISWNDFVDIVAKFSFAAKSMVEAETKNEYPTKKYDNWYDYALSVMLKNNAYGKVSKQDLADEYALTDKDNTNTGDGEKFETSKGYNFTAFHSEMETIAWAVSSGNGLVGNDFLYDVRGNQALSMGKRKCHHQIFGWFGFSKLCYLSQAIN